MINSRLNRGQESLLSKLLSNRLLILVVLAALALFPFISGSRGTLILLTHIMIFACFAMSYDILLGYTGIVSFGHAMYFGIGAYTTAILMRSIDNNLSVLLLAAVLAVFFAIVISVLVGMLSLRLKIHFYALLTLAFAELVRVVAEKWRGLTRGYDGMTFPIPDVLRDRVTYYFLALVFMVIIFLLLKRFTDSPVGRVLQSVRDNEQRAESLGFRVLYYKVLASVVAGVVAALSGIMYAMSIRFVNTEFLGIYFTLDALIMTLVGGAGTLFGPVIAAFLLKFATDWLGQLAKVHWIFERWIIFYGLIFVLAVIFLPGGLVGNVKLWIMRWQGWWEARKRPASPAGTDKQ